MDSFRAVIALSENPLLARVYSVVHFALHPLPGTLDNNIRLLYVEIFWAAILGGVASFNAAYAVRLGATDAEIGLLSSLPPLIAALLSIPFARFLERKADRRPYIVWSLLLVRLGYAVVALMPTLVPDRAATWLVIWLILLTIPGTLFTAGWQPLMADILPERRRAMVFSRRMIINFTMVALVTALGGRWLNAGTFPHNYQIMYAVAVITALISTIYVAQLQMPKMEVAQQRRTSQTRIRMSHLNWVEVQRAQKTSSRAFRHMTINTLVYNFGVWVAGPLFILYYVRDLNADDGWIGLHAAAGSVATVVGYYVWERVIRQRGFSWVMMRMFLIAPFYTFAIVLFPNLTLIVIFNAVIGFINSGVDLSHFNVLLKLCPPERRTSYLGFFMSVMNGAAFIAPLISVAIAEQIGYGRTLLIAGVIRVVGALLFWLFPVEEPPGEADALPDESEGQPAPLSDASPAVPGVSEETPPQ